MLTKRKATKYSSSDIHLSLQTPELHFCWVTKREKQTSRKEKCDENLNYVLLLSPITQLHPTPMLKRKINKERVFGGVFTQTFRQGIAAGTTTPSLAIMKVG
jgi:hypothetical protein